MKKISSSFKTVYNPFGIQLLPNELRDVLFGVNVSTKLKESNVIKAKEHLLSCGLQTDINPSSVIKVPNFDFPFLEGQNISQHFQVIAQRKVQPYIDAFQKFIDTQNNFAKRPNIWTFAEGWTRYDFDSGVGVSVDGPEEECLAFDVEVCVNHGHEPIIATALSQNFWYSWCSPILFRKTNPQDSSKITHASELISFKNSPSLIIGHNVGYDRARIKEEYQLTQKGRTRFLDTMSLHITVSGMTTEQRAIKTKNDQNLHNGWTTETSLNNLADVYKLYCPNSKPLRKSERDIFVQGNLQDIKTDFQNLMSYCSEDTEATYHLSKILFELFLQRCPHPASLFGLLEFGKTYLPIDESWFQYIRQSDCVADELNEEVKHILEQHAREACQLLQNDAYKSDPWMWNQNWTQSALKIKKKNTNSIDLPESKDLSVKFKPLIETKKMLHKSQPRAPGYPTWFQDLCSGNRYENWCNKLLDLSPGKSIVPQLLRLSWNDKPLYRHPDEKWGFIYRGYNKSQDESLAIEIPSYEPKSIEEKKVKLLEGIWFSSLPHKDGVGKKVGNPLSKDFMDKVSDGTLTTKSPFSQLAHKVLSFAKTMSYWKSNRDRILSQMISFDTNTTEWAILPQSVASGTITRRSVEKTWLTASNAKSDRIGSELKTLIRAPEGYHIVGADVDSQELWIAAVLGDASFIKEHGCTAMGWMTLQGNKNEGTDMHSKTAEVVGVTRDQAKILNYGRIYGAGLKFAKMLLKKFNPSLDNSSASASAREMYESTKGQRVYYLNELGAASYSAFTKGSMSYNDLIGKEVSESQIRNLAKVKKISQEYFTLSEDKLRWNLTLKGQTCFKTSARELSLEDGILFLHRLISQKTLPFSSNFSDIDDIVSHSKWIGGSESYTFNSLEHIVLTDAKTPVLKSSISRALETNLVGKEFLPSRINWVVQSSGVDYMHLLLLAMDWLMKDIYQFTDEDFRFLICIHDEVRYVVKSYARYRAAYCLNLANLMVRTAFVYELGMTNLPLSVAFFSGVDIDKVMRKDPENECVTPSNPQGLHLGYGISQGECLTFEEVIQKLK